MARSRYESMPVMIPGDWTADAACIGYDPDLFFPAPGGGHTADVTEAKSICAGCPVTTECLEFALRFPRNADHGVWGGTTVTERETIRRRHRRSQARRTPRAVVSVEPRAR